MLAHSYLTTQVDVTAIARDFADVKLDNFVYKAAAKAFKDACSTDKLTVARVHSVEERELF